MSSPVFFIFTLRKPKDQLSPNKPWSQDPLYHHWHWHRWQAPCLLAWQLQFPAVCWVSYISESPYRILMAHKLLFEMLFIGCPSQNQGWIQQCHCLDETAWVGRGNKMSQLWGCSPAVPIKLMWKGNFEKLTKWSRLPRAWQCRWKYFNGNIPAILAKHIWVNHNELYQTTHNSWESLLTSSWEQIRGMKSRVKNPGKLQVTISHESGQLALSHTIPRQHLEFSRR